MYELGLMLLVYFGWIAVLAEIWLMYKINKCRKNYDYDKSGLYICLAIPLAVVAIYWIWRVGSVRRGFGRHVEEITTAAPPIIK